jgi:hypothetical protein
MGASVILLLNATVWQPTWPSWWTGKIGDCAWLIIAPFFVAALLTLCLPKVFPDHKCTGVGAILITGLGFGLVKTVPPVHTLVIALLARVGFVPKLLMDPSDLLALPFLLVTWLVWNCPRSSSRSRHTTVRVSAFALAVLALIADSPAPVRHGVVCLTAREDGIYALSQEESLTSYFGEEHHKYWTGVDISADGGATWQHRGFSTKEEFDQEVNCSQVSWPLEVGQANGDETQLYFVSGQGIYSSEDAGQTLRLEQKLADVYSALVEPTSGNLIIAAGLNGMYVRTPQGEWSEVAQ